MTRNLIVILGDQLSSNLSSLRDADPKQDMIFMAEVSEEATYVKHHKKKVAFVFSAMRHHAERLRKQRWRISYTRYDDSQNTGSLAGELESLIGTFQPQKIVITAPGEWRLKQEIATWQETFGVPIDIREDDRFLCSHAEFEEWAEGRKQLRMEYFYREMRKKTGLLMEGDKPAGGKWNYDADNRKPACRSHSALNRIASHNGY